MGKVCYNKSRIVNDGAYKMQDVAHVIVSGEKILVLRRPNFHTGLVSLKLRKSGSDGIYLQDESLYLEGDGDVLSMLKNGQVIKL